MRPNLYIETKAVISQLLLKSTWFLDQHFSIQLVPWPWADTFAVAQLTWSPIRSTGIATHTVSRIVLHDANMRNLAFGPSKLAGKARTNDVIFGHRDTHFAFLKQVQMGDMFELDDNNTVTQYRVTNIRVINETDIGVTANTPVDAITLITCYPFDQKTPTSRRFVVRAVAL